MGTNQLTSSNKPGWLIGSRSVFQTSSQIPTESNQFDPRVVRFGCAFRACFQLMLHWRCNRSELQRYLNTFRSHWGVQHQNKSKTHLNASRAHWGELGMSKREPWNSAMPPPLPWKPQGLPPGRFKSIPELTGENPHGFCRGGVCPKLQTES